MIMFVYLCVWINLYYTGNVGDISDVITNVFLRFGGKLTIGIGMCLAVGASFLSPPMARWSPYALMVARFINGIGQVGLLLLLLLHSIL